MGISTYVPHRELVARHDVVVLGYRGVDGSSVLACPEVREAVTGVGDDLLGAASLDNLGRAFRQCAERLTAEGIELDAYTMVDVIHDMEAARQALGYPRVHLLSESYGTRVAQLYAHLHPDRIGRSVMIGVNPPGRFVWEPAMTDRLLEHYSHLCANDPVCSARTDDLARTLRTVSHRPPRRWLLLPIDAGKVKVCAAAMLFNRDTAALVFDAFLAAEQGDASGLALLSLSSDFLLPSLFVWGDLAAKAVSADYNPQRDYATDLDPPGSILGAPISKLLWTSTPQWPITPIPAELRQAHDSQVETLLVSGSVDLSTPPAYPSDELLPRLPNGHQVILAEMGHTQDLWDGQPTATEQLLTSFFDTGVVDDSRFRTVPMDFSVSWGLPRIAKLSLALVVLVVVCTAGLAWLIWRRRRFVKSSGQQATACG